MSEIISKRWVIGKIKNKETITEEQAFELMIVFDESSLKYDWNLCGTKKLNSVWINFLDARIYVHG